MRAILVAAGDGEAAKVVKGSFRGQYRVDTAPSREACEQLFAKAKYAEELKASEPIFHELKVEGSKLKGRGWRSGSRNWTCGSGRGN